ncbi:beta-defensin 107A-like [Pteropus medius]|uniref:Beta-defensin n=1 Tax=Pteropus vampyrus TaxID=132908 RepID=A0A6P3R617_PTEVA|nr:beta-defensin 107A-like [Pteropus vampyrus]XP_039733289.1 beta-defensin 107A-like [Pteropus giganteus]
MPRAMRTFPLIFAAFILLAQIFSARGGIQRQMLCAKMNGRCEAQCLSFEDKIGGCRAELTPFCCKRRKNN